MRKKPWEKKANLFLIYAVARKNHMLICKWSDITNNGHPRLLKLKTNDWWNYTKILVHLSVRAILELVFWGVNKYLNCCHQLTLTVVPISGEAWLTWASKAARCISAHGIVVTVVSVGAAFIQIETNSFVQCGIIDFFISTLTYTPVKMSCDALTMCNGPSICNTQKGGKFYIIWRKKSALSKGYLK